MKAKVMADQGPSLPPNYVTFLHLKQRWLQQQSDSQLTVKPEHDSASKLANDAVSLGTNPDQIVSQSKPHFTVRDSVSPGRNHTNKLKPHDSASKNPNKEAASSGKHRNRIVYNQFKTDVNVNVTVNDSGSKSPNEVACRPNNRNRIVNNPVKVNDNVTVHDSGSKSTFEAVIHGNNRNRIVNNQVKPVDTVHDSGYKSPNKEAASRGRHRNRIVNYQVKPDDTVHDSGGRNRNRIVNEVKPEATVHESGSKTQNDVVRGGMNRNRDIKRLKAEVAVHDSGSKAVVEVADNHLIVEKQENNTVQSNSRHKKKKKSYKGRNPRSVIDLNQTGSSTEPEPEPERVQEKKQHAYKGGHRNRKQEPEPEPEPEPKLERVQEKKQHGYKGGKLERVQEKKQHGYKGGHRNRKQELEHEPEPEPELEGVQEKKQHGFKGGRRNQKQEDRNQEVWESKGKTSPFGQNVDDRSLNESGGDGVVEAVVAAVKEISVSNVCRSNDRRWGSGSSYGGRNNGSSKPPVPVQIWVRKGESAQN